jgi:hypothetical protein
LVTFALAVMVGFPLGSMVAVSLFGQPGLGGIIGIFAMMLVFGYFNQRLRDRRERGESVPPAKIRMPGMIGGRVVWVYGLAGAAGMAIYGAGFAARIGEPAAAGAVGLGLIGFVGGFVLGIIVRAAAVLVLGIAPRSVLAFAERSLLSLLM